MKAQSSDKLSLGHLNMNSIRNKYEALKFIIEHKIKTTLDGSFPTVQLLIKGSRAS